MSDEENSYSYSDNSDDEDPQLQICETNSDDETQTDPNDNDTNKEDINKKMQQLQKHLPNNPVEGTKEHEIVQNIAEKLLSIQKAHEDAKEKQNEAKPPLPPSRTLDSSLSANPSMYEDNSSGSPWDEGSHDSVPPPGYPYPVSMFPYPITTGATGLPLLTKAPMSSVATSLTPAAFGSYHSAVSPHGDDASKKRTRERRNFTVENLEALQTAFDKNPYPARKELETLAFEQGISYKNCKLWFQNHRAKLKREGRLEHTLRNFIPNTMSKGEPLDPKWTYGMAPGNAQMPNLPVPDPSKVSNGPPVAVVNPDTGIPSLQGASNPEKVDRRKSRQVQRVSPTMNRNSCDSPIATENNGPIPDPICTPIASKRLFSDVQPQDSPFTSTVTPNTSTPIQINRKLSASPMDEVAKKLHSSYSLANYLPKRPAQSLSPIEIKPENEEDMSKKNKPEENIAPVPPVAIIPYPIEQPKTKRQRRNSNSKTASSTPSSYPFHPAFSGLCSSTSSSTSSPSSSATSASMSAASASAAASMSAATAMQAAMMGGKNPYMNPMMMMMMNPYAGMSPYGMYPGMPDMSAMQAAAAASGATGKSESPLDLTKETKATVKQEPKDKENNPGAQNGAMGMFPGIMPGMPNIPGMPNMPGMSSMPGMPNMPGMPPNMSGMPYMGMMAGMYPMGMYPYGTMPFGAMNALQLTSQQNPSKDKK